MWRASGVRPLKKAYIVGLVFKLQKYGLMGRVTISPMFLKLRGVELSQYLSIKL